MGIDPFTNAIQIVKEPGVFDLPPIVRSKLAQAVKIERVEGHTTPEAEALFEIALIAEAKTLGVAAVAG